MSKRRNKLEINKFYYSYGGNQHPSLIFKYNEKHKTYLSLKFGTTKGRHMTEIHPLKDDSIIQYVHNRPFEGTRSDYGDIELIGFSVNPLDKPILDEIKKKQPTRSKNAKARYEKTLFPGYFAADLFSHKTATCIASTII